MTRVLALRAPGLGDVLTAVPALRGIRRASPGAQLVLAGPAPVGAWLEALGVVDDHVEVRDLDDAAGLASAAGPPDVAVNLHGRGPQSHRLLSRLRPGRLVAYACPEAGHLDGPGWRPDEHEVDRWVRLSQWAGGQACVQDLILPPPGPRADHVVLHPGAASPSRCWPTERWAAVAAALADDGHRVVVTGTSGEAALCAAVVGRDGEVEDRCGLDDLAGLAGLVGTAALALSGDTGVAHLATAFRTPSVTLFGPVSPALWGPRVDGHLHRVLWRGRRADGRSGDPLGTHLDPRLAAIPVVDVVRAARALLDGGQALRAPTPAVASSSPQESSSGA